MNSTATTTLTKGRRYDAATLIRTGWTHGDGSGHAGYNAADFFDADCRYLGADIHGIEPIFSDESVIEYVDAAAKTIRDQILEVLRDGRRIDRFLEIVCDGRMPSDLFLTTENTDRDGAQFRVPALLDTTPEQEEAEADAVIDAAIAFLTKQS